MATLKEVQNLEVAILEATAALNDVIKQAAEASVLTEVSLIELQDHHGPRSFINTEIRIRPTSIYHEGGPISGSYTGRIDENSIANRLAARRSSSSATRGPEHDTAAQRATDKAAGLSVANPEKPSFIAEQFDRSKPNV